MINLLYQQKIWVYQRGGRTVDDVGEDTNGLYVVMAKGDGRMVKVYMPAEEELVKEKVAHEKSVDKYRKIKLYGK